MIIKTSPENIDTLRTFSARQHIAYMLSAPYAIVRPSVCPSGRHTGGSVEKG